MEVPEKCLVHMRTTESVKIRTLFETLYPILLEGTVNFDEKGMSIKGLNIILLADMLIRADDVEDYVCNEDVSVCINFKMLWRCISAVAQDEAIAFQVTEASHTASVPYLSVFIINNSGDDEYVYAFKVVELALEPEPFEVPSADFKSVVAIPSNCFARALACCEKQGEKVQIVSRYQSQKENYVIFRTKGDMSSVSFHMNFQVDAGEWKDNTCLKLDLYSLKYLRLITKATNLSSFVQLYLAENFVLGIRYNIGTIGSITFCLAPSVERADDAPPEVVPVRTIFNNEDLPWEDGGDEGEDKEVEDAAASEQGEEYKDEEVPKRRKKKEKKKAEPVDGGGIPSASASLARLSSTSSSSSSSVGVASSSSGVRRMTMVDNGQGIRKAKRKRKTPSTKEKKKDTKQRGKKHRVAAVVEEGEEEEGGLSASNLMSSALELPPHNPSV